MKIQTTGDIAQQKMLNLFVLEFCRHTLAHVLQIRSKLEKKKQLNQIDTHFIARCLHDAQQALHLFKKASPQQQVSLKYVALLIEVTELATNTRHN